MSRVLVLIAIAFANAFRGVRQASTTSLLAVLTIAVVLVLVGSASLLVENMVGILDEFGAELQLTAYLDDSLADSELPALADRVTAAPGVEAVEVVTKAGALERFKRIAGGAELLAGLEENPLPASLEIRMLPEFRTAEAMAVLEESLDGLPGIDELAHGQEWIEGYARAVSLIRGAALGIGIVLGLAALLIVANTIRLAFFARRDELDILALVGASRTFVRVPFLLEGTLQGLLGGLLALLVVYGAYELLLPQVRFGLELVVGRAELRFFSHSESLGLVAAGAGLGLLGSITALVGWRSGLMGGAHLPGILVAAAVALLCWTPSSGFAQDRAEELEGLRDRIQDSREKVTSHEADERALLEQLEDVDRSLMGVTRERDSARREVRGARERLSALEPSLEQARQELALTQTALASRARALYRGGELGPVRVLFSATSLQEMLSRAGALRVLVKHDATLVARFGEERDRLEVLQAEASAAVRQREEADARLTLVAARLKTERESKGEILGRVRKDRTSERRLLLELEQAAQALEETIRTLGARAESSGGVAGTGFATRRGRLAPPVSAEIAERFGKVIDPEFQTTTFRSGIDFAAPSGSTVRSVATGVVRFAGWFRGYGRIVIVDHGDAFHTISGHLDEIHVKVGTPVSEGESLGTVGETGSLGGPSLYFELRRSGEPVDPAPWLMDPRG